jgi:hypothetical protein
MDSIHPNIFIGSNLFINIYSSTLSGSSIISTSRIGDYTGAHQARPLGFLTLMHRLLSWVMFASPKNYGMR